MEVKICMILIRVNGDSYNYWRNKFTFSDENLPIAPISIKEPNVAGRYSTFVNVDATGVVQAFPNGLRAHFGRDSEQVLMEGHVMSE